jgi:hypothetical protein
MKCIKILVAYVHFAGQFEGLLDKVFLVITLNVLDMLWTCLNFKC